MYVVGMVLPILGFLLVDLGVFRVASNLNA